MKAADLPLIDVAALPDPYIALVEDCCWNPILMEGDRLLFSKTEAVRPGDFVSIIHHPGGFPPGHGQALVKRYLGAGDFRGEPVIWCDMINPKATFPVPVRVIQALHPATAIVRVSEGPGAKPKPLPRAEIGATVKAA